jgi:hypothetical protein
MTPATKPPATRKLTARQKQRAISEAGRINNAKRKTYGAGTGRPMIEPPTRPVGPFDDRCGQACQLRIAGASLQYIGDQMGVSRERARQLIAEAERKHPALFRRVQKISEK